MNRRVSILTNLAFHQSQVWSNAVTSICQEGESPDDLSPFQQICRLLKQRSDFDVVVTMGPRPSLFYGVICGLLFLPSKQIMTEVFLDQPRPSALSWRIKMALFRWISRRSIGILTNSSAEVGFIARRFGISEKKLRFVPMHTTIAHPEPSLKNEVFILSVGRTFRDLDTLLQAAPHFGAPLVLIIGKEDGLPRPLPNSVQVLRELPLEKVHEQMRRTAIVVIPLLPAERSTGQVVLFEAMALGKPVVAPHWPMQSKSSCGIQLKPSVSPGRPWPTANPSGARTRMPHSRSRPFNPSGDRYPCTRTWISHEDMPFTHSFVCWMDATMWSSVH